MVETVLRMHCRGLSLGILRIFSPTVMTGIASLSTAQEHLEEKRFHSCLVNASRHVFTLNTPVGKKTWYSYTSARVLSSQKYISEMFVTVFAVGNTRGIVTTPRT